MYAESVGVPLIIRGPDVEQGRVETAAVSHIDIYNTVLNSVGIPAEQGTASARSQSLLGKLSPDRVVMSEYHIIGSSSAVFMLQDSTRPEERRVGKECGRKCRSRWWPRH